MFSWALPGYQHSILLSRSKSTIPNSSIKWKITQSLCDHSVSDCQTSPTLHGIYRSKWNFHLFLKDNRWSYSWVAWVSRCMSDIPPHKCDARYCRNTNANEKSHSFGQVHTTQQVGLWEKITKKPTGLSLCTISTTRVEAAFPLEDTFQHLIFRLPWNSQVPRSFLTRFDHFEQNVNLETICSLQEFHLLLYLFNKMWTTSPNMVRHWPFFFNAYR